MPNKEDQGYNGWDPSSPVPGQFWFRSDLGLVRMYDGQQVREIYNSSNITPPPQFYYVAPTDNITIPINKVVLTFHRSITDGYVKIDGIMSGSAG